jgi:hypothetical protein
MKARLLQEKAMALVLQGCAAERGEVLQFEEGILKHDLQQMLSSLFHGQLDIVHLFGLTWLLQMVFVLFSISLRSFFQIFRLVCSVGFVCRCGSWRR